MGKNKKRKPGRTPSSPAQIKQTAAQLAELLLDMSDDETDRALVAAFAIIGDREAVVFFTHRLEDRGDADELDEILSRNGVHRVQLAERDTEHAGHISCDERGVVRRG